LFLFHPNRGVLVTCLPVFPDRTGGFSTDRQPSSDDQPDILWGSPLLSAYRLTGHTSATSGRPTSRHAATDAPDRPQAVERIPRGSASRRVPINRTYFRDAAPILAGHPVPINRTYLPVGQRRPPRRCDYRLTGHTSAPFRSTRRREWRAPPLYRLTGHSWTVGRAILAVCPYRLTGHTSSVGAVCERARTSDV
jgi:hypothetical protein